MADLTASVAQSHREAPHQTGHSRRDPEQNRRRLQSIAQKFDESKHPRDKEGQFTEGSSLTAESLTAWAEGIREHEDLAILDLRLEKGGDIQLETIAAKKGQQGQGAGTRAMEALIALADTHQRRIVLGLGSKGYQPIERGVKTSSPARLRRFYQRFGFLNNRGRYKDYRLSIYTAMYRNPVAKKYDPQQPRGAAGSGQGGRWIKGQGGIEHWSGPGSPPEDITPTVGRTFTSEEGYQFHEQGPVAEWAKQLPYAATRAVESYVGFGYKSINEHLRGNLQPDIKALTVRPATSEEVATAAAHTPQQFGYTLSEYFEKFGSGQVMGSKPGVPEDPYHRVLDAEGNYVGHVTHIPYTSPDDPANFEIRRFGPDYTPLERAQKQADEINALIRDRGYVLPEAIQVERGAYFPGVTIDDLQRMADDGTVWEEKAFTSTAVGDAGGRMRYYPVGAKSESLYNRYGSKMEEHKNEVGTAVRFHITLPEGTRVASAEAIRRLEYRFPRNKPITDQPRPEDIPPEQWVERNYDVEPTVSTERLEDKEHRVESELLLGSGARFRVVKVKQGVSYEDSNGELTPIVDVHLEYIGGGSSEGTAKKADRTVYANILKFGEVPVWR